MNPDGKRGNPVPYFAWILLQERIVDDSKPRALVVPASSPNGYGVVRSLAARGISVLALDHTPSPLRRSRLCDFRLVPDPDSRPMEFGDALLEIASRDAARPALFVAQDLHGTVVQQQARRLERHLRFPFMDERRYRVCIDKRDMLRCAAGAGLDVPESHWPADSAALRRILPRLNRYPYVLKPAAKFEWRAGRPCRNFEFHETFGVKALRARTPEELRRRFDETRGRGFTMIVQEEIEGPADRLVAIDFYADANQRILVHHTGRKLRQYPSDFGTCTLGETCSESALLPLARRLVAAARFHGIGNIEFKRRGDRLYLMEINPRPWMWIHLATAAGINIAHVAWRDLIGLPPRPVGSQRDRTRWVDTRMDAYHLGDDLRRRLRSVPPWMLDLVSARSEARWAFNDPLPLVSRLVSAAGRRLARRVSPGKTLHRRSPAIANPEPVRPGWGPRDS